MKGRLYTAGDIVALAYDAGQRSLVLGASDRITPLALDRARELGVEIIWGDGGVAGLPTWSGAALQERRGRTAAALSTPPPPPPAAPAPPPAAPAPPPAAPTPPPAAPTPPPAAPSAPAGDLEARVREAVLRALGLAASPAPTGPAVVHASGSSLQLAPFPFQINRPQMDVRLQDVITHRHGSPMAAGFMSLRQGEFPWHLDYDEIEYVIEGELHIGVAAGVTVGRPGDVIYVPKGSDITFGTPSFARFLYVTYPAQWSG